MTSRRFDSSSDPPRVLMALSGGVDSAVAAALLVEQGYEVIGAMLSLWSAPSECAASTTSNRCCTPDAVQRAEDVARQLGFPFHLLDARSLFREQVVEYFIAEYAHGRTPNPCVICNRAVRFNLLIEQARTMGASWIATGHYARVREQGGTYHLLRGTDRHKDQSYFLHALTQEQLRHTLFPVGGLTKAEVRATARRYGLSVAEQPESQDVCFLGAEEEGDYRRFLARYAPHLFRPGPIRDRTGRVLGEHQGLPGYTVGQRKGLGLTTPEPVYVLSIEPAENALIVGTADELMAAECRIGAVHYICGKAPLAPFRAIAQIRYRARPTEVIVTPTEAACPEGEAGVRFSVPQRGVTPGQFLVLYEMDDEQVIGGGVILSTGSTAAPGCTAAGTSTATDQNIPR